MNLTEALKLMKDKSKTLKDLKNIFLSWVLNQKLNKTVQALQELCW